MSVNILWCGGEDIDFPNGGGNVSVDTTSGDFRSAYARCSIYPTSFLQFISSTPFSGGAITSAWLSARVYCFAVSGSSQRLFGLVASGSQKGLYVGIASANKLGLFTYDGTTTTLLASEAGTSVGSSSLDRLDLQLVNYGGSSTVNVYWNGSLLIAYSGSTSISGVSGFSQVGMVNMSGNSALWHISEIIVSDSDTRTFSLATLAPNGAGHFAQWTGAYTDVNEIVINDANTVYTNTASQNESFTLTSLPTGVFGIVAVKVIARTTATAGAAVSNVAVGVYTNSTLAAGTPVAQTTSFMSNESILNTNPVTAIAWTQSDISSLQPNLQSS